MPKSVQNRYSPITAPAMIVTVSEPSTRNQGREACRPRRAMPAARNITPVRGWVGGRKGASGSSGCSPKA